MSDEKADEPLEIDYGDWTKELWPVGYDANGYALTIRQTSEGWRFSHVCKSPRVPNRRLLRIAPLLSNVGQPGGHQIIGTEPLHIEPSILCADCGLHGWVRDGKWVSA